MPFYADLHIHSKYSRATSRECDLEHLALWAGRKGIAVVSTGDFTHPAWIAEIKDKLAPAEPGLFRLREEIEREVARRRDPLAAPPVRFLLSVEISTIYKKGLRTRKVHHLIIVPGLEEAERLTRSLARIGNLKSDGRPILGLDSRDLLEITLESGAGSYLIPAHIWTPWFSVLGSKSGFDSIEECYEELTPHIFALETGLSSDPPMNWRLSGLDRYRLVSNSDAHSPGKLGREACVFHTGLDYFEMRGALETGQGYGGTIEFFPEEGKYHLDGHRKCGTRLLPGQTREHGGLCPVCGKPVTVGVMHRVEELADRDEGAAPEGAAGFRSLIPLVEVLAEIMGCGAGTKGVAKSYDNLVRRLGPELFILEQAPLEEVRRASSETVAEALSRMREGRVIRQAGYDGEYGVIRLFEPGEIVPSRASTGLLFELGEDEVLPRVEQEEKAEAAKPPQKTARKKAAKKAGKAGAGKGEKPRAKKATKAGKKIKATRPDALAGLDPAQQEAAGHMSGPLLIIAGPGTGKTRTLTHRIARLVAGGVPPGQCLAITFTRRAAREMRERLGGLLGDAGLEVPVMTFHALGLCILREHAGRLGLPKNFRVADEALRASLIRGLPGVGSRKASRFLAAISRHKREGTAPEAGNELAPVFKGYQDALCSRALLDFDDLLGVSVELLESDPGVLEELRGRWRWISVDEYQDIDEMQYRLVRLLAGSGNICAIGDPDQAIYGFRGADVGFFLRFCEDFAGARTVSLGTNYRSSRTIVDASAQLIAPSSLAERGPLEALFDSGERIVIREAQTERAEAEFVVHSIERMIGGHGFFSLDSGRVDGEAPEREDFSFGDFAVLYRTDAQSGPLIEALARSGIPFQKRSHARLSDDPLVSRIVSVMSGQGGAVEDLARRAADIAREADKESGAGGSAEEALELLLPLARSCGRDLERFFGEVAMGAEVDLLDPRADRVSLLTLHAAKGLEFRVVFMVGCEDGLIPLRFGGSDEADVEEERRLFFVGMTRARELLFLSHANRRLVRGRVRKGMVSPFLADVEEELLSRERGKVKKKASRPGSSQLDLFRGDDD